MNRAIICFTRVPKPGVTKTRLLPILTGQQCAALHTAFLTDLSAVYGQINADLFVAYTYDPDWAVLKHIFPGAKGFIPQDGLDLGEKMYNALRHVLELGYEAAVLTGSDLPRMTVSHIESGFTALNQADLSIGPTSDGGYYLVGMKKPHRALFENQQYGGNTVLENTIAAAKHACLSVSLAASCDDVDTPADLQALSGQLSPESATYRCIQQFMKEGLLL